MFTPGASGGQIAKLLQLFEESIKAAIPIERIPTPRSREISTSEQVVQGAPQHLAWSLTLRPTPQDAADSLGRVAKRGLKPALKRLIRQILSLSSEVRQKGCAATC